MTFEDLRSSGKAARLSRHGSPDHAASLSLYEKGELARRRKQEWAAEQKVWRREGALDEEGRKEGRGCCGGGEEGGTGHLRRRRGRRISS